MRRITVFVLMLLLAGCGDGSLNAGKREPLCSYQLQDSSRFTIEEYSFTNHEVFELLRDKRTTKLYFFSRGGLTEIPDNKPSAEKP